MLIFFPTARNSVSDLNSYIILNSNHNHGPPHISPTAQPAPSITPEPSNTPPITSDPTSSESVSTPVPALVVNTHPI